jgi:hypothetical protein
MQKIKKEKSNMRDLNLSKEQIEKLIQEGCRNLGHFELRLYCYAVVNGGQIVISRKTMENLTGTGKNNVNKQLAKADFKGMAELDLIEGTVYTLKINLGGTI